MSEKRIVYFVNKKAYERIKPNEIIKKDAMQSWCNERLIELRTNKTVGKMPSMFTNELVFYNKI